jgi:hypothetical protein
MLGLMGQIFISKSERINNIDIFHKELLREEIMVVGNKDLPTSYNNYTSRSFGVCTLYLIFL